MWYVEWYEYACVVPRHRKEQVPRSRSAAPPLPEPDRQRNALQSGPHNGGLHIPKVSRARPLARSRRATSYIPPRPTSDPAPSAPPRGDVRRARPDASAKHLETFRSSLDANSLHILRRWRPCSLQAAHFRKVLILSMATATCCFGSLILTASATERWHRKIKSRTRKRSVVGNRQPMPLNALRTLAVARLRIDKGVRIAELIRQLECCCEFIHHLKALDVISQVGELFERVLL